MWKRLIWFLAAIPLTISAQVTADTPAFTADEISIYRDFLLHYPGVCSLKWAWEARSAVEEARGWRRRMEKCSRASSRRVAAGA